jgi:predicted RNA-binding Zn ribbon-like protein
MNVGRVSAIPRSDWRDGFLFVGNQLALDFLNTRPVQNGKPMELLSDFSALLRWLQAGDLLSPRQAASLQRQWGESDRAGHTVKAMRQLRERLRKEVLSWEQGDPVHPTTLAELNRLMADHPMLNRLEEQGEEEPLLDLWFEARQPEHLFAPLAHSAAMLFASADRNRVRMCDQCVLHFRDVSKKGTRRWCSMQLCGNRLKVAAYAARRRTPTRK